MYPGGESMNTIIDRFEIKYLLNKGDYNLLINKIKDYLVKDKYFKERLECVVMIRLMILLIYF